MGIGTRIKEERKRAGITQPELGEKIGVHETTIRRWEQERDKGPDAIMVQKIAEVLGVSVEDLMTGTENKTMDYKSEGKDLVYEWGGTNRLALPNTPETRAMFERLVLAAMGGTGQVAMA